MNGIRSISAMEEYYNIIQNINHSGISRVLFFKTCSTSSN